MQSHSQWEDDGGSPVAAARRERHGHMPQPEADVGMTTRGGCATLPDQDIADPATANDDNKDCFSCSCPSAPLSSACSISSASGLSNSLFLSQSLAGQTMTPLSMEGSEYNAESEPAVRKLGRPPTPFDAMAGLSTLDELVTSGALDAMGKSCQPATNNLPPTPLEALPPGPQNITSESPQPRDASSEVRDKTHNNSHRDCRLPAGNNPAPEREICCDDNDSDGDCTGPPGGFENDTTPPDGTYHRRNLACSDNNSSSRKCDDALDPTQQPADATPTGHFTAGSPPMLTRCQPPDQGKQLHQGERQRCCPTQPAAAEPRRNTPPPTTCTTWMCGELRASPTACGRPGADPTWLPGPLNPPRAGAIACTAQGPCAPEHDVPRPMPINPKTSGPVAAAQGQKINNTNPKSQNSNSRTTTASRDSPFSSPVSPPSHPSSSALPPSSLVPLAASIQKVDQSDEEPFVPLVRRASDNSSLRIQHPIPDINPKSATLLGNIAQLEATAERLSSTTASIEDAIRELHTELKRSDSQRSALALSRAGIQSPESESNDTRLTSRLRRPPLIKNPLNSAPLARRRTHSGRTTAANQPARYRARSGSLNAVLQPSAGADPCISSTGPGNGSVECIRTGKQSLTEISESEPITLTRAAFDAADQSNMADMGDNAIRPPSGYDKTLKRESFIPSTDAFHAMLDSGAPPPSSELFFNHHESQPAHYLSSEQYLSVEEQRPTTSASNASSTHLSSAFRDFDGVHCDPELNFLPPPHQQVPMPMPMPEEPPAAPFHSPHPKSPPKPQPTSYLDHETGQEMLYYPARVPAMLSLPPKLSKKPKAAVRNQRQSHVLSTMPEIARRSGAAWLPDPLSENSFLDPISLDMDGFSSTRVTKESSRSEDHAPEPTIADEAIALDPTPGAPEIHVTPTPGDVTDEDDEVKPAVPRPRKDNAADVDVRKSHLSKYNSNLPPQLRASVFFDMPSNSTKLEVKDGSATATLDHLLDASTQAPVSAFTDHIIAGKLGSEVYGVEKRRSAVPKTQQSPQPSKESEEKKRGSIFHRVKKSEDLDRNGRSESGTSDQVDDEALPPGAVGYATLSPDSDENDENDKPDGEDDEDEGYYGPPTTLLAELQLRKQEQKNRTRPINQAHPNGMHSTLLELDAVAEEQRKNRKGKRVNLAWEDPNPIAGDAESDDEDVPLGVLFAAKAAGTNDINVASAELNRPLGLMERRELEENEPLSQRRARLQGRDTGRKRQTLMPASATRMSTNRLSQMPSLGSFPPNQRTPSPGSADQDEEIEGETLGERMRRLKKKEEGEDDLPRARPVSASFSAELLSQFGEREEEKEKEDANAVGDGEEEEEETLGQRRRRLQAERENQGVRPATAHQASASLSSHGKRLSMANILAAHPMRDTTRQEAERRRAEEEIRFRRSQEEKLAALRSQMPTSLERPSVGAATGGFVNGRFNDGTGGTGRRVASRDLNAPAMDLNRSSALLGGGMMQQAGRNSMMAPGAGQFAAPGFNPMAQQYNGMAPGWYPQMQAPMMPGMQPQMPMQMGMPVDQGHSDSIERWRRSVMP